MFIWLNQKKKPLLKSKLKQNMEDYVLSEHVTADDSRPNLNKQTKKVTGDKV